MKKDEMDINFNDAGKGRKRLTRRTMLQGCLAIAGGGMLQRVAGAAEPSEDTQSPERLLLWYAEPASKWIEALPLGNGRLGAMVFGGTTQERIGLNEDTLWSGGPYDPAINVPAETLEEIRHLVFTEQREKAQEKADKEMLGIPRTQASYQTVGELRLDFAPLPDAESYRRELDLDTAIATVNFNSSGVRYTREVFASPVENVIVVRLTANRPGSISLDVSYKTPQNAQVEASGLDCLRLRGHNGPIRSVGQGGTWENNGNTILVPGALKFESRVCAIHEGGEVTSSASALTIRKAETVTLLVAAATSYRSYNDVSGDPKALCAQALERARSRSYAQLRSDHVAEHQRIFHRVSLTLGKGLASELPTDQRLKSFRLEGDPGLAALYFQFGRYLLISSSRKGGQPANLQGMWNQDLTAPWGGKYTININTEMNYWPSYSTNMAECDEPLLSMVQDLAITGARTAQKIYRAKGWVCHHNTDLWRATAPIDGAFWGLWPTGGVWLCNQLYERYTFTLDKAHLTKLYPIMKGSARFFLETLVEDPKTGWLVTCPSVSPEHERTPGVTISAGPTMDMQLLHELFGNCIEAAHVLGIDSAEAEEWAKARKRLAPMQVGKHDQLQEWLEDIDATTPETAHRHMSPLYGLFPGNQITAADPKLMAGARKLMEMRTDSSGFGWGQAWRSGLWARLGDGNRAAQLLQALIREWTESNMFDKPVQQLDGNFGGTSAITEMILQSHAGEVHLLPALPAAWPEGSVSGLLARGGFQVSIGWKNAKLHHATIRSSRDSICTLRYGDIRRELTLKNGMSVHVNPELDTRN
jgi:alpha-L-fucosidase 2